jgi:ribose transport system ATP-binding protein
MQGIDHDTLIRKMVGRDITSIRRQANGRVHTPLLSVENLCLKHPVRVQDNQLKNLSFTVGRGEIVGIFGLMGAGRTELLETLFGLHPKRSSGTVSIDGQTVQFKSPIHSITSGMALVPEDRKKDGLILGMDVQTNISLTALENIEQTGFLSQKKEMTLAKKYIADLRIKTPSEKQTARNLSGGNQQKIVLSKWLATNPKLLMLDEPTRGIDVNAKNEIYKLILQLADEGMGIIVVSSELPEILAISDRILVLCEGNLTAEMAVLDASEDSILKAAIPKSMSE